MKKSKCDDIKTDNQYHYTSEFYCFAPTHSFSKKILETVIKTDDKTVLELMHELREMNELLENDKIKKIANNEHLYDNNCFTSVFKSSNVFLKSQGNRQKIIKKLK